LITATRFRSSLAFEQHVRRQRLILCSRDYLFYSWLAGGHIREPTFRCGGVPENLGNSAGMAKTDARKKSRANNLGQSWWRKLSLPRRGKKETLLSPPTGDGGGERPAAHVAKISKRTSKLRKAIDMPRTARLKHLTVADWDGALGMARVVMPRGNAVQSMGIFIDGVQYLFPEEAAYLIDRAQLDMRVEGVPASLQRAWGLMLEGRNAITLDQYCAFAHLRRIGYVVRRPYIDKIADTDEPDTVGAKQTSSTGKQSDAPTPMLHEVSPAGQEASRSYDHDPEAQSPLQLSFSVWRVGAFRRKETHRPLFNLIVCRYEDSLPRHAQVAALLTQCTGKTRLRAALIDRGVVVLVDLANNATPLSSRYLNRLAATNPSPGVPAHEAVAGHPLVTEPTTSHVRDDNAAVSAYKPRMEHVGDSNGGTTSALSYAENDDQNGNSCKNAVKSVSLDSGCPKVPPSAWPARCFDHIVNAVHALGTANSKIEFHEITNWIRGQDDVAPGAVASKEDVRLALEEMARQEMVVLSSGREPCVFVVHDDPDDRGRGADGETSTC
jgi:hypothetical protein